MFDGAVGGLLAAEIAAADPSQLSDAQLIDYTCAVQRLQGWVESCGLAAAAEFSTRRPPVPELRGDDRGPGGCSGFAVDELGAALAATGNQARRQMEHGVLLAHDLPHTRGLLEQGLIGAYKAGLVCEQAALIDDPTKRALLDARLAGRLAGRTSGQIRRSVIGMLHRIDPAAAVRRRAREQDQRGVGFQPQPETGMTAMTALLPGAAASRLQARLRWLARAAQTPTDSRTLAQRTADVLVDLAFLNPHTRQPAPPATPDGQPTTDGGATTDGSGEVVWQTVTDDGTRSDGQPTTGDGAPVDWQSVVGGATTTDRDDATYGAGLAVPGTGCQHAVDTPIVIHVTVPATTLLGTDHQPGELSGYGPIDAALARRLAQDPHATWRRILTDPASGTVLDVGHTTYRPPAALARHVRTRDKTCRFVGCHTTAARCQQDHTTAYAAGGATAEHNLGELCTHHHQLKHHAGWHLHQPTPGTFEWTTPTGHRYTVGADTYPSENTTNVRAD